MRHLHAFRATVVGAMLFGGVVFAAATARGDEVAPRKQLLITRVDTDLALGRLRISGYGFCLEPTVTLAGERIAAASAGGAIVADLPPGTGSGDHLLTVQCGTATTGFDAWSLTTGAVGPPGPAGERGARGPRGRPGAPGAPFAARFYTRSAKFKCRPDVSGESCLMREDELPVAHCDEGDVATGGSAFRLPKQNRLSLNARPLLPYPIGTEDAPSGMTTDIRQLVGYKEELVVTAICVDLTP